MRNTKSYTNQTFTKRVDHEGGLHRPAPKPTELSYCRKCGAVYGDGRWVSARVARAGSKPGAGQPSKAIVCPACKQIENGIVGGYVSISGDFVSVHRAEIRSLVENEAKRALDDNPLSRIMTKRETDEQLLIETTTEHLAQRLGHALKKAFSGEVSYDFSHENKVARVYWNREV